MSRLMPHDVGMSKNPIKPEPESERVIVIMSHDLIAKIEAYRRSSDRIPSRSEAVRELIEAGVVAKMGRLK